MEEHQVLSLGLRLGAHSPKGHLRGQPLEERKMLTIHLFQPVIGIGNTLI